MDDIIKYTVRDAVSKFSEMIRKANEGHLIAITNRKEPVAAIIPLSVEGFTMLFQNIIKMMESVDEKDIPIEFQSLIKSYKLFLPLLRKQSNDN